MSLFFYLKKNKQKGLFFKFIFSYEGEVVDEYSLDSATHIVVSEDDKEEEKTKSNKTAKRISFEILWKSIKNKKSL